MAKIALDKYYTEDSISKHCVEVTYKELGNAFSRIVEPSAGGGSFLKYLPETTQAYDIAPEADNIVEQDYLTLELPYLENSLVIGNPPFGRANKLSVKFINRSILHSEYIAFIQPISQLNNDRLSHVDLVYSEDLGEMNYSGKPVHCCFNIYHRNLEKVRDRIDIKGVQCRHIFRTGKCKHKDSILNDNWDFRIAAWGHIGLLAEGEYCTNEVVLKCTNESKAWVKEALEKCDFMSLISAVSTPNLTAWRVKKYLKDYLGEA